MSTGGREGGLSLLVDTTGHVFNVFGFVLEATVIVVSLHTRLYFTADGGAQLSAKRAFLKKKKGGREHGVIIMSYNR